MSTTFTNPRHHFHTTTDEDGSVYSYETSFAISSTASHQARITQATVLVETTPGRYTAKADGWLVVVTYHDENLDANDYPCGQIIKATKTCPSVAAAKRWAVTQINKSRNTNI
jgi:hypothetical protein